MDNIYEYLCKLFVSKEHNYRLISNIKEEEVEYNYKECICGSDNYYKLFDYHKMGVYKCNRCGITFINPRIKNEIYNRQYKINPRKIDCAAHKKIIEYYGKINFDSVISQLNDMNMKLCGKHNVLDIGCGFGGFIGNIKENCTKNVYATESSSIQKQYAKENYGIKFLNDLAGVEDDFFDYIFMFDVIEHILYPIEFLTELNRVLKQGGILFFQTPNSDSFYFKILKSKWIFFIPTQHIFLYNKKSMEYYLELNNFNILKLYTDSEFEFSKSIFSKHNFIKKNNNFWIEIFKNKELNEWKEWDLLKQNETKSILQRMILFIDDIVFEFFKDMKFVNETNMDYLKCYATKRKKRIN